MVRVSEEPNKRRLEPEFHTAMQRMTPVLAAADAGDDVAMAELRAFFDHNPAIWQQFSAFMGDAESVCIESLAPGGRIEQEVWRKRLDDLRSELLEPTSSPLEKMLVDRIAMTWLYVQQAELQCSLGLGTGTLQQGSHNERRLDRAQARYLAAVKALAQVRRLQRHQPVQMNIAENQINFTGLPGHSPRTIEANSGERAHHERNLISEERDG